MFNKISLLKSKNYVPDIILDIGAHYGSWTDQVSQIYENSKYYLFEAIDYPQLNRFKNSEKFNVNNLLLNDKEDIVDWYEMRNTGDSMFKELNYPFKNCNSIKKQSTTLDIYFKNFDFENKNIFIKIDCQGAEIPILKGATKLLSYTNFILLEIPFFGQYNTGVANFLEHIKFMDSIGFIVYDIVENHYINDYLMQIDIIFIKKDHKFNELVQKMLEG